MPQCCGFKHFVQMIKEQDQANFRGDSKAMRSARVGEEDLVYIIKVYMKTVLSYFIL